MRFTTKKRRSGRLTKAVPILLIGSDSEGRVFTEQTRTVVLSQHGAGVVSRHKLSAEEELVVRSLESGQEAEARIVGEIASDDSIHTYGLAFIDESLDFWKEEFPPAPPLEERPLELILECGGCGAEVTLLNGDYEFDVCAIHGGLVKYCPDCGFPTVWRKRGTRNAPLRKPAPAPRKTEPRPAVVPSEPRQIMEPGELELVPANERFATEQYAPAAALRTSGLIAANTAVLVEVKPASPLVPRKSENEERRQRVRAKVNYFACVRSEAFGDDVVNCIDMSRGGLGFRTKNAYLVSTEVRVAVPFSPEAPNAPAIFVDARVMNIMEIPGRGLYRCGIAFLQ